MSGSYEVPPWVTHERLDDEVMAIDLESGAYFALDDVAADAWSVIANAGSLDDAVAAIAGQYDVSDAVARGDLERFVATLVAERLLVPAAGASPGNAGTVPATAAGTRRPYAAPVVNKFDDLEELLRLDPVHEVDEVGWPVARRD